MQLLQEKKKYSVPDSSIFWASGAKGRAFESRRAHHEINPLQIAICEGFSFPQHYPQQDPTCFSLSSKLQLARYAVDLHALGTAQAPFIRVKEARPHETPYCLVAADAPLSHASGFVPNVE